MELPQETEDYIRESIDQTVGLPVSNDTLLHKLRAAEASHAVLRGQYLSLRSKLNEKDEIIEQSRAEASMNAMALKKFVEENQKLAMECSNLLDACNKLERECALYDHDREALMDFANEADERGKEAGIRNRDLEEEKNKLLEELQFYNSRLEGQLLKVDVPTEDLQEEQILLDSLLSTVFGTDEITSAAQGFLESHSGVEVYQKLLKMWPSLRPISQKVVALAADAKNLQKDKDHLTINLHRAEEEVNVLFEENKALNEEYKRLMRRRYRETHIIGSGGGSSSTSGKGKRKSSPKMSCPVEKKLEFSDVDSKRQPLSPLQCNPPESRMRRK